MKKTTKLLVLSVTSLTVLTGCKGKEITKEEAKDVLTKIVEANKNNSDAANYSFTYELVAVGTVDGQKARTKQKIEYDYDNNAVHVYLLDGQEEEEAYMGLKDGTLYSYDVTAKEYYEVSVGAEQAWATAALAFNTIVPALNATTIALIATVLENESYTFYSSGEGHLHVEGKDVAMIGAADVKGDCTYTIKDNKITNVTSKYERTVGGALYKINQEEKVKYSASVKLPSTSGYTKVALPF